MRGAILIIVLGFCFGANSQKSIKRGIAYGYHSKADMLQLEQGISWWYNWYHLPDEALRESFQDLEVAYVPMAWNGDFEMEGMRQFLSTNPQIEYLLGFNEPNFTDQANMTPSEAATAWSKIEAIADEFDLKIIGPAVNYCGNCVSENGITYSDPIDYLDDFFEVCVGCQVDYLAVHWYGCGGLDWYLEQFSKYGLPIWVTEIACWDQENITLDQQKSFLINAVDQMESNPLVEKYAWFTGRGDGPYISVLGSDGELTSLGEFYVKMPIHDPGFFTPIPARIEAEAYQQMLGIQLELCADGENEINVGYLEAGDYLEYNIEVPKDSVYVFDLRYAGVRLGKLDLVLDEIKVLDVSLPATGGWQSWSNSEWELELPQGEHKLKIKVLIDGFNLNWIDISFPATPLVTISSPQLMFYPNPANRLLNIEVGCSDDYLVTIFNINNQVQYQQYQHSVNQSLSISVADMPDGLYFLHLESTAGIVSSDKFLIRH